MNASEVVAAQATDAGPPNGLFVLALLTLRRLGLRRL